MFKHTQSIRRFLRPNCSSVLNHFVGLALKGLMYNDQCIIKNIIISVYHQSAKI